MPDADHKISLRQVSAAVGLWIIGFVIAAAVLHATVRDPLYLHAASRSEKLAMINSWHGKVFSAAFGSSHVHNGFDPRVFDRALAGSPVATRSANLAIEGGSQSEQRAMALEFLKQLESPAQAHAPSQSCLVMLELNAGTNFTNDHLIHPRAINIYDWATTRLMSHFIAPAMPERQRFGRVAYAVAAMGLHYANIGMVSNLIFSPPLDPQLIAEQTADDRRGQHVETHQASMIAEMHREIAQFPKHPATAHAILVPGNTELVEQLHMASPISNVSFVYFLMPKLSDLDFEKDYPDHLLAAGEEVPIVNLARPDLFPQLYKPELWHDDAHLAGDGAELVSMIFAKQLRAWYEKHGGPRPCGG